MTAPYHMRIAPTAHKQLLALESKQQKTLVKCLEALTINPHPPGVKRIDGMVGLYNQPLNHLRFIYKVEEQEVLLLLVK